MKLEKQIEAKSYYASITLLKNLQFSLEVPGVLVKCFS